VLIVFTRKTGRSTLSLIFTLLGITLFEFYRVEDPEHLFGEGKYPLTHYVPFTYNSLSRLT
jgi:hypothetical protein